MDAIKEGDDLCYYLMSDKLTDEDVTLTLELMDFSGKVYNKRKIDGKLPANTSLLFAKENWEKELKGQLASTSLMHMTVKNKEGEVLSDEIYYFAHPKDQQLSKEGLSYQVKEKNGKCEVTLKAKKLTRDIFIEIPEQGARFSDNFFDLLPGQQKKVVIDLPDGRSYDSSSSK